MSSESAAAAVPKLRFPEFANHPLHDLRLGDLTEEPSERNKTGVGRDLVMGVRKDDGIVPMEQRLIAGDITRYKIVKKDWFAYNPMRLNIGSISRWQGENGILVSPDYVVFRCRIRAEPTPLFPAYLDHYRTSAPWNSFVNASGDGSVRTRVYYDDLAQLPMLLPDIAEQQKIAECLSSLDAVIAAERKRLAALKDHKKGLMQGLFPAPGQTTPSLRFSKFAGKGEWVPKSLRTLCSMKAGTFIAASEIDERESKGLFPCFGGNGLRGYTPGHTHSGRYPLIGRQGALCGNVNLADGNFYATEHAIVADPKEGVSADWLYYALDHLALNRFATGQAQPGLSVETLGAVCI